MNTAISSHELSDPADSMWSTSSLEAANHSPQKAHCPSVLALDPGLVFLHMLLLKEFLIGHLVQLRLSWPRSHEKNLALVLNGNPSTSQGSCFSLMFYIKKEEL